MVVFVCNACGDSLKKQQVDYHIGAICRGSPISCIDCSKNFDSVSYRDHIRCITELEKYSGAGYQAKPAKGQQKQDLWTERLQAALAGTSGARDADLRAVIERMITYDNIPRKKAKFANFMSNSFRGMVNPSKIERIWNIVESQQPPPGPAQPPKSAAVEKPKPAVNDKQPSDQEDELSSSKPKFHVKKFVVGLLDGKPRPISLAKLRRKIVKASEAATAAGDCRPISEAKLVSRLERLASNGVIRFLHDHPEDDTNDNDDDRKLLVELVAAE